MQSRRRNSSAINYSGYLRIDPRGPVGGIHVAAMNMRSVLCGGLGEVFQYAFHGHGFVSRTPERADRIHECPVRRCAIVRLRHSTQK